jgi:hypothetical protein
MHLFFLFGKFSFYEKSDTIFSSPFLFIKYSKTTYQKHHKHVNIQNMKVMGHIFNRIFFYGALNRGTKKKGAYPTCEYEPISWF